LFTGPYTQWPNRAEAVVRVFKATLHDICAHVGTSVGLKQVSVRELLSKVAVVRNSMVTYGGKAPIELVYGRRPGDNDTINNASPETTDSSNY
jgi:hypothetical protein